MITRRTFMRLSLGALAGHGLRPGPVLAQTRPLLHIRVVHTPVLIFAPLYVAIERGYFAQQGLETELIGAPGGASAFAVLASGRAEAAVGGLGAALFNAAARGLDFRVVGPAHLERPPVARRSWSAARRSRAAPSAGRKICAARGSRSTSSGRRRSFG